MSENTHADVERRLHRYRTEHMEQVQGWFNSESAEVMATILAHQVATGIEGGVAEIGVHHGKSFLLLANGARADDRAVALDVFGLQEKNVDKSGLGDRVRFEANAAAFAPETKIDIVEASSLDYTPATAREVFGDVRLMSIDGGHTADITAHDLALAEACVVDQGVVVLDDVLNPHWLGVVSGLFRFLASGTKLVPFAYSENKLYLAPSTAVAADYAAMLRQALPDLLGKTGVELTNGTIDAYGPGAPRRQAAAKNQRSAVEVKTAALQERATKLEKESVALQKRIQAIESSNSWRLTAPLRALSGRRRKSTATR